MRRVQLAVSVALSILLVGCHFPVPRDEWPIKDDPLFPSAVWIDNASGGLGSGAIVHSSPEHGTYILTAGHMLQNSDGYLRANWRLKALRVGVFALSHHDDPGEEYVEYEAAIVATTVKPEPSEWNEIDRLISILDQSSGHDSAILRLKTDRLFKSTPIFGGDPASMAGKSGSVVAVVPEMYPHRLDAKCEVEKIVCLGGGHGTSGAPMIVSDHVVGLFTYLVWGPGPVRLQAFVRSNPETAFLLKPEAAQAPPQGIPDASTTK